MLRRWRDVHPSKARPLQTRAVQLRTGSQPRARSPWLGSRPARCRASVDVSAPGCRSTRWTPPPMDQLLQNLLLASSVAERDLPGEHAEDIRVVVSGANSGWRPIQHLESLGADHAHPTDREKF